MPTYVTPSPPFYTTGNLGQAVYTAAMTVAVIGFIVWWLRDPRERSRPHLPLILAGGAIATLFEPTVDNMVLFGWPHNAFLPIYSANGHPYPLYLLLGYIWFDGGLIYLSYRLFERGLTTRQIWTIAGGFALIDVPANAAGHWFHFNGFFGPQPMEIFGYPVWWLGSDVVMILLGGALLQRLIPLLGGWSVLLLLAFPVFNQGISAGTVVWPASYALHAGMPQAVRWLLGLATIAMAVGTVWVVTQFAASDRSPQVALRVPEAVALG